MSITETKIRSAHGIPGRPHRPPRRLRRLYGYLFVLPSLGLYVAFAVIPALQTFYFSLFKWNGITAGEWVGFDNFVQVFNDPLLRGSLFNALVLVFFSS